jgi:hypothetical protein
VKDAQPGDSLFLHCNSPVNRSPCVFADLALDAGHGYQRPTKSDTEPDNMDEGETLIY